MNTEHWVAWNLQTLNLAFIVIAIICAVYIIFKAFQVSPWWGLFFVAMPLVYMLLGRVAGVVIAGVVVIVLQAYFIKKHWKEVGRFFVYTVLCWVGMAYLSVRSSGWIPDSLRGTQEVAQAGTSDASASESYLPVEGGRIWYKVSGTAQGTPVILLHGGPGYTSHYLKSLEALGTDRPVVRYDQLGSGHSDRVIDTTLFTIAHFVRELDSLRAALGYEKVHLVGHSWGAILGFEYYRAHPDRVASLTLASAALSSPEWMKRSRKLLLTLSDSAQKAISTRAALNDFDAPDYVSAMNEYYEKYVWRRPVPEDLDSTMKTHSEAIYSYMWGPSEFDIRGTLKGYDATPFLRRVKVPTLYTVGEFDEAGPETAKKFAARTPGAKLQVISDAAHITTWDNPQEMLRVVREFLRSVDSTASAAAAAAAAR